MCTHQSFQSTTNLQSATWATILSAKPHQSNHTWVQTVGDEDNKQFMGVLWYLENKSRYQNLSAKERTNVEEYKDLRSRGEVSSSSINFNTRGRQLA